MKDMDYVILAEQGETVQGVSQNNTNTRRHYLTMSQINMCELDIDPNVISQNYLTSLKFVPGSNGHLVKNGSLAEAHDSEGFKSLVR